MGQLRQARDVTMRAAFSAILLILAQSAASAQAPAFGPWRLGMTAQEVEAVEQFGPYSEVAATGGLETPKGSFMGEPANVSFVFDDAGRLYLIQVWAYEGEDGAKAEKAFYRVYGFLRDRYGALHSDGEPWPDGLSAEGFSGRIPDSFRDRSQEMSMEEMQERGSVQAQVLKLHLHPQAPQAGAEVFGSLIRSPQLGLYWVFLYVRSR